MIIITQKVKNRIVKLLVLLKLQVIPEIFFAGKFQIFQHR